MDYAEGSRPNTSTFAIGLIYQLLSNLMIFASLLWY